MKTPIDIISGFLGAGKTTLLNEMLKSIYKDKKIAVIENDFGDVNVDVDILPDDIDITEMTNGCACCTIRVGLIDAIKQLIALERFDRIVIEPSGVANVSDIQSVVGTKELKEIAKLGVSIAVVNPIFHINYSNTLGICYHDQIENSDIVFLNRISETDEKTVAEVMANMSFKTDAEVVTNITKMAFDVHDAKENTHKCSDCETEHEHHEHHEHHHHHEHGEHCHHKDADEEFISYSKSFSEIVDIDEIPNIIEEIVESSDNRVLRIKGIVKTNKGSRLIQWVPSELNITECDSDKNGIVIIEHQ